MWTDQTKTRVKTALWHYIPVALVGLAVLAYLRFAPASIPTYQPVPQPVTTATEPKSIVKVQRITVPGPTKIVYLDRVKVEKELKWFPEIKDNVLAVATIPAWNGPTTAIASTRVVDNTLTGEIIYRQEPPKFLQVKRSFGGEAWYYFVGQNVAEANLVANPVRIGPVDILGKAGVAMERGDATLHGQLGIGIQYRF